MGKELETLLLNLHTFLPHNIPIAVLSNWDTIHSILGLVPTERKIYLSYLSPDEPLYDHPFFQWHIFDKSNPVNFSKDAGSDDDFQEYDSKFISPSLLSSRKQFLSIVSKSESSLPSPETTLLQANVSHKKNPPSEIFLE